jgi:cytochrome c oxidase subunit 1
MFATGMGPFADAFFAMGTMLIAIPTGVKIFNWIGTMWGGSLQFRTPMLFAVGFIAMFIIGGLSGVMHSPPPADLQQTDTYFVVAHFHYVMFGGSIFGLTAGAYYWWPKMFGKMYSDNAAAFSALFVFLGFNITFFTQFLLGARGMPRRYYHYNPEWQVMNIVSTVGSWLLAIGLIMIPCYLIWSLWRGRPAPANPWGGRTLEWQTSSPPITENFEELPVMTGGPYDYGVAPQEASVK